MFDPRSMCVNIINISSSPYFKMKTTDITQFKANNDDKIELYLKITNRLDFSLNSAIFQPMNLNISLMRHNGTLYVLGSVSIGKQQIYHDLVLCIIYEGLLHDLCTD